MSIEGKNLNPVFQQGPSKQLEEIERQRFEAELGDGEDAIDNYEVFDMLRHINDPEHPLTLEQLHVVKPSLIKVDKHTIDVEFTPTIPNCSMATLIGLMIRVKLHRCLPSYFKLSVNIESGKHDQETEINKQLNDKERVFAALENTGLLQMVNKGLVGSERELEKYLKQLGIE